MPGILVVEDDENLNRGITFSLKKSGYEVFSAPVIDVKYDNNEHTTYGGNDYYKADRTATVTVTERDRKSVV